jgi:hypothetical protein
MDQSEEKISWRWFEPERDQSTNYELTGPEVKNKVAPSFKVVNFDIT